MRRSWIPLLVLITITVSMLFVGDYLTGREHRELQDPYSRTKQVLGRRFGFPFESTLQNEMSEYYFNHLKQPRNYQWEASDNSYKVDRFTGQQRYDTMPVAPVMYLDTPVELAFLQALPTDRLRLAVIHSLFQPRKKGESAASRAYNQKLVDAEGERVRSIYLWYKQVRNDPATPFPQWWRDNARFFGLTPEGAALPPTASAPEKKSAETSRNAEASR